MNRTSSVARVGFRGCLSFRPRGLVLAALLACAGGCAEEDPVARLLDFDAGPGGDLAVGDEGPDTAWAPPEAHALPDCSPEQVDAGTPCADAGARE